VTRADDVAAAVADAHRRGWAIVLAATARVARDLDLAEECVQEAYAAALTHWARDGLPRSTIAWLTTTAKRRAVDAVRRERVLRAKLPLLIDPDATSGEMDMADMTEPDDGAAALANAAAESAVPDERLRLIFLCCHPALAVDVQLALTLRLVCGVSTPDVARALLVTEPTMAARLTRAKKKIATARIPFRMPAAAELPDRLRAVLGVIHLLFSTGYTAPSGPELLRTDLVEQALHLARMLHELMPDEGEVRGLLALLLVTDARRATRTDADGRLVRLADQDRARWDGAAITEAVALIDAGLRVGPPGRYLLQAAIAATYATAPSYERTDWPRLLGLYDALLELWPSPVVALNRTVPLSYVAGAGPALAAVTELERDTRLSGYQYLPAVKADLLERLGRADEAADAHRQALARTRNEAERRFLSERVAAHARRST
jgi:RNA polymerase sigma factor (sigma-70 family)